MKRFLQIFLIIFVLAASVACEHKPKVLKPKKMSEIYADLFIADSWLRDNQDKRRKADTTLFLDPIFEDHKVDYKDFYVSIEYYTAHPDEYSDILTGAIDIMQERYEIISVLSEQYNLAEEVRKKLPKYHIINFGADSMKALGDRAFWHPDSLSVVDSIPQLDTLVRKDTLALTALDTLKASDKPLKPRNPDMVRADISLESLDIKIK